MAGPCTALFVAWNCFPRRQLVSLRGGQGPRASICKSLCCHDRVQVVLGPGRLLSRGLLLHPQEGAWGGPEGGLGVLSEVPQGEESGGSVFVMSECCRIGSVHVPLKRELAPFLLSVVMQLGKQ